MQHTWLEPFLEMFGRRRDDTVHPPRPDGPPPPGAASGPVAPSPFRSGPGGPIAVEASVRDLVARHEALHMLLVCGRRCPA